MGEDTTGVSPWCLHEYAYCHRKTRRSCDDININFANPKNWHCRDVGDIIDGMLPEFFKPLLWSYDISQIDVERDKKMIIVNAVNYGDLCHWRWLVQTYGKEEVSNVISRIPVTELRPRVRRLAAIFFSVKNFNYAPRGARGFSLFRIEMLSEIVLRNISERLIIDSFDCSFI